MKPDLNPAQAESVSYTAGPLLVLAGAGSGKTQVITQKIARQWEDLQAKAHFARGRCIVALTFTNKAAREMKTRVAGLLNEKPGSRVWISTFHTFGLRLLKEALRDTGVTQRFSLLDTEDSLHILKEITQQTGQETRPELEQTLAQISQWKNQGYLPEHIPDSTLNPLLLHRKRVYEAYQQALGHYQAVDFDDLILKPLKLLQENPVLREKWQNRLAYLLVDEYQDTNLAQYQLMKLLVGQSGAFTVVGDDHQSVYAWRGARPENIHTLQVDFPNLKVIKLEQNYRSTNTILQAANTLIGHNPSPFEKRLWSALGAGNLIQVIEAQDEADEAERVAVSVLRDQFSTRRSFSEYAVLYRSNHQSRVIEKAFREHRIPYQITGGSAFFSKSEVKDILAYLRLMHNPEDDLAFLRVINVPRREIGQVTVGKLAHYAQARQVSLLNACFEWGLSQHLPEKMVQQLNAFAEWIVRLADNAVRGDPYAVVESLITESRYFAWLEEEADTPVAFEKKRENVLELLAWLKKLFEGDESREPKTFGEALQHILLMDMMERHAEEKEQNAVQLMTLHAAKGLEFPHVSIIGVEDGILPHKNSLEAETIEEERRLAYVGLTRAKAELQLFFCTHRKRYQDTVSTTPSRFLSELPAELLHWPQKATLSESEKKVTGNAHLAHLRAMLKQQTGII